jgi:hypothetical protein
MSLAGKSAKAAATLLAHPLFIALVTILVGSGIFDRLKRNAEVREARRAAAEKVFQDLGPLMDRRLYWSQYYHYLLTQSADSATLAPVRARMDSTIIEWNTRLGTNAALVCFYFGPSMAETLTTGITDGFKQYTFMLREARSNPEKLGPDLDAAGRRLAASVQELDRRLAGSLRGDFRPRQPKAVGADPSQSAPRPGSGFEPIKSKSAGEDQAGDDAGARPPCLKSSEFPLLPIPTDSFSRVPDVPIVTFGPKAEAAHRSSRRPASGGT